MIVSSSAYSQLLFALDPTQNGEEIVTNERIEGRAYWRWTSGGAGQLGLLLLARFFFSFWIFFHDVA